jgi:hypothetical protein
MNDFRLPSSSNSGPLIIGNQTPSPEAIRTVKCAKCGKEIAMGQEVKKGFLIKKSYHKECAA